MSISEYQGLISMVYSKGDRKAYEDSVGLEEYRGKYRLNLARKYSRQYFGKEQKRIATGLTVCKENKGKVEQIALLIHYDILSNNFDTLLVKYGLGKQPNLEIVTSETKPVSLLELYDSYCESRKGSVEETTLELEFKGKFRRAIVEAIDAVGEDALAIRKYLVEHRQPKTVKECLRHLSKAYQLGVKHKKIIENPFDGMAEEIEISKGKKKIQCNFDDEEGDDDTRAFTVEEMNAIIEAFESSGHRRHLAPIIKFLFWTGCRTGEAVGLKWRDIKWDRELITIRRTYSQRLKLFKPTKKNIVRYFPIPKDSLLWNLLKSMPERSKDDIVFPSKTGKIMDANKLGETWRGKESERIPGVIPTLIKEGKVKEYLRLYATRHTFISHQVNICKVPITTVAQWVGNSALVSNNSYLDTDKYKVPGNPNTLTQVPINNLPNQLVELLTSLSSEQIEQLKFLLN
jgi:integrase